MIEKALNCATNSRRLLVFDEPDFPEVPLQVPGGSVEKGEPVIDAARREFGEETGLVDRTGFRLLGAATKTVPNHTVRENITGIEAKKPKIPLISFSLWLKTTTA